MHLRMTGDAAARSGGRARPRTRGCGSRWASATLLFVDPRRFGTGRAGRRATRRWSAIFAARLGVEPFDEAFTGRCCGGLRAGGGGRSSRSCSISATSRASATSTPTRRCFAPAFTRCARRGACGPAQYDALARRGARAVLSDGIDARGASIDDFRDLDGARGSFQDRFLVHRREGSRAWCAGPRSEDRRRGRGTYVCRALPAGARRPSATSCARRPERSAAASSVKPPTS